MKKTLRLLSLAALTIGLLGSCSKINERIDGLDKRVYDLENNKIASVEQQIAAINQSIADLSTIRTNIQNLKNEQEAQGQDITDLQAEDQALEGKINDLKAYVDTELANYATTEWAKATFATLEKLNETNTALGALEEKVNKLGETTDAKIAGLKTELTDSINTAVSNLETRISALEARVSALEQMIQSVNITPAYSDGSVEAVGGILTLKCIVSPAEALIGMKSLKDSLLIYADSMKVKTKATTPAYMTIEVSEASVLDAAQGAITLTADISKCLPKGEDKALTVAVNIKNGISDFTTEFVPVTVAAAKPIAEYVEIGGVKWATKNLGASTVGGSYSTCTGDYLQYGAETTLYNSITWDGSSATFNWKDGKSGGFTSGNGTYLSKAITDATDFVFNKAIRNGWRTPTRDEFKSLINACGGTDGKATPNPLNSSDPEKGVYWLAADQDYLAEYKGVAGVLFVDGNKTKLFFPTTGYGKDTSLINGTEGRYWTRDYSSGGFCCLLTSQDVNCTNRLRNCYGAPIRPVLTSTDIHLYPYVGASATLTATALQESAVTWTSSNVNVVSVSNDGVITVKGEGAATITASTADSRKVIFAVSVAPEPEYIEMAGIKWATKNLGATKIAGSYATCAGDFYQWGSIETLYESITWNGNSPKITWKSGKSAGYIDDNREYKETPETLPDDRNVVKMKIKDGWSMPTNDDFKALYKACGGDGDGEKPTSGGSIITNSKGIYYCENYYGVPGVLFCDGINTLFFPETGSLDGTTHQDESYSWTPSFYENRGGFDNAYCAHIDATRVSHKMYFACYRGFSIRPVKKIEK